MGRANQEDMEVVQSLENDLSQSVLELEELIRLLEQTVAEVADSELKLKQSLKNFSLLLDE